MSFNLSYQHLGASANKWMPLFIFYCLYIGVLIKMFHVIFFPCKKAVLMAIKLRSHLNDAIRLAVLRKLFLEHFSFKFFYFEYPTTKSGFSRNFSVNEFSFQNTEPILSTDHCHLFFGKYFVISSFLVSFALLWDSPFLLASGKLS